MKIEYDVIETAWNKKWNKILLILTIISIILLVQFVSLEYSFISVFVSTLLFSDIWRNYFILKQIKCPNCKSNYFTPFFANRDDIKSLLKSNPKCINCNNEAEIISEYKSMY